MEKKKRRRGRWSFLNDFKMGDSGQYSYMGTVYSYEGELPYKEAMRRICVFAGLIVAAVVAVAVIPAPSLFGSINGPFTGYVVIPFLFEAIAVFITAWGVVRLVAGGPKLREYSYEATVKKIPIRAMFSFIAALALIPANVVFICLNGFLGSEVLMIVVIVLHGLAAGAAFMLRSDVKKLEWSSSAVKPDKEDGPTEEEVFPAYEPEEGDDPEKPAEEDSAKDK